MTEKKKAKKEKTYSASVAKTSDGSVQITFTISWDEIKKNMNKAAEEMGKTVEIPGFRKGKAPVDQVLGHVSYEALVEKSLQRILPLIFSDVILEHKIKPAMYPKFELLSTNKEEDWEVRAQTCEIGEIKLGDYKEKVNGALRAKKLWVPGSKTEDSEKEPTKEEKENEAISVLLKEISLTIPHMLVHQEADIKLAQLLERVEKLGLTLESYLASIKKNVNELREEYEKQAEEIIKLELILNEIARLEKIQVSEDEVSAFINAASGDPELLKSLETAEQRQIIVSLLKKRKVLDSLTLV